MKEFIEKLNKRLEEIKDDTGKSCSKVDFKKCHQYKHCGVCLVDRMIDIVNELAEEYKGCFMCYFGCPCEYQNKDAKMPLSEFADDNGWIPCSEILPEYDGGYICTAKEAEESLELLYSTWDGLWRDEFDSVYEVIAWQPLPEPYIEK